MPEQKLVHEAFELMQKAYEQQMEGDLDLAVKTYKQSISKFPTAEAHTFLGWAYGFQGKLEEAIDECKKAIRIDPDFGNPYNDIGTYLIELESYEEAIPWLKKAARAKRYEARHYPHFNLGRVYLQKDLINKAIAEFKKALEICPGYSPAMEILEKLKITFH